mmetsp:Transcript_8176/g.17516  ORF Transcript_8176/g.17516 Transcript_8176/m.17516 type:complete len:722 (-) Transcript_8176:41-2206(-)
MSTKAWLPVTFRFLIALASCHCWGRHRYFIRRDNSNDFFLSTTSARKTAAYPRRTASKTKEKCVTLYARPDALDAGPASFPITHCDNSEVSDWENNIRDEAATALLPVFFPFENVTKKHFEGSDSKPDNLVLKPITAEVALKRLLRRKYQQVSSDNTSQNKQSYHGRNEARRRLSSLILGTGVMRLRHWYYIYFNGTVEVNKERPLIIPYPLDYSILEMMNPVEAKFSFRKRCARDDMACTPMAEETNDGFHPLMRRMKLVRAMVDEHARYLRLASEKNDDTLGTANSSDLNATIMNLSIEYSIPPFLISSLLSQYGYTITQQICSVMNHPGPVTIRKNAIKFPWSDDKFCQWVREEDEVNAAPMARLLLKESKHENPDHVNKNKQRLHPSSSGDTQGLRLVAPKDGQSNCFVIGESFKSTSEVGMIEPPVGCLQIIPRGNSSATNPESEIISSPTMNQSKSIWSMKAWKKGYFEVQDAGSQFIVQSLQVQPGDSILDYCAGNGGKTFGLASAIRTQCLFSNSSQASYIVAHDVVDERLRQVKGSMSRVGFVPNGSGDSSDRDVYAAERGNVTIEIMNSSTLEASCLEFDAVLVDAPCSSSGVLRRRPSQRWEITQQEVFAQLPYLQLSILEKAASFVRKGGRLIYSTCSVLDVENDGVVDEFERTRAFSNLGFSRWDFGLDEANDKSSTCNYAHGKHTVTMLPTEYGNDGFFVARWIKRN